MNDLRIFEPDAVLPEPAAAASGPSAPDAVASGPGAARAVVVLVNLGTPTAPTPAGVRPFLREFLSDRRVVNLPPAVWKPILEGIVLSLRPRRSARLYAAIWRPDGSPLMVNTLAQAAAQREALGERVEVRVAMTYGAPNLRDVLTELEAQPLPVLVVPLYPQYSGSATGAVHDAVSRWALRSRRHLDLRVLRSFPTHPAYLEAVTTAVRAHWDRHGPLDVAAGERLVLSYHGIPVSHARAGDPYPAECAATSAALVRALGLPEHAALTTFQSKFGPGAWLTPATIDTMAALGAAGTTRVDVVAPGFVADCVETLEEIAIRNRHRFVEAGGGTLHLIPWANASPAWTGALARIVGEQVASLPAAAGPSSGTRDHPPMAIR